MGLDELVKSRITPAVFGLCWVVGWTMSSGIWADTYHESGSAMGSKFEITAVHEDPVEARIAVRSAWAEIERIEAIISSWRRDSETSKINAAAGLEPVKVSDELYQLIRRSLKVSEISEGAFDISFAGAGRLWDFNARQPAIPAKKDLEASLVTVGWEHIQLDSKGPSVFLPKGGMRIGFGGIGKGYAANRAVAVLKSFGVTGGVVSAGGDLRSFGRREDGELWSVGIANPRGDQKVFAHIPITNGAVVTSGDYERFFVIEGQRYAHILDPRTGWPVDHLISVTVLGPDAELADALATASFVMGPEKGLALLEKIKDFEGIMITSDRDLLWTSGLDEALHKAQGTSENK